MPVPSDLPNPEQHLTETLPRVPDGELDAALAVLAKQPNAFGKLLTAALRELQEFRSGETGRKAAAFEQLREEMRANGYHTVLECISQARQCARALRRNADLERQLAAAEQG